MKALLSLAVALWLSLPGAASAHRLDEYLQATTVAVGKDRIVLRLRLTPGVSVAPAVLAEMDADGDGVISAAEQRAYAARVVAARSLSLDGHPAPLRLRDGSFSPATAMRSGSSDVVLEFDAAAPSGPGRHRLVYDQRVGREPDVYLTNALTPVDAEVRIVRQSRSFDQSSYRLDYEVGRRPGAATAGRGPVGPPILAVFFAHGVRHILTGYDHLLFVAALALGAASLWELFAVVTVFTVAHSLTLTLAVLGLVRIPPEVVEPLIAASIIFVAVQNLLGPGRARGATRLAATFAFGLVHGLGFAGGLLNVMHGMEQAAVALAIVGFSLGIEFGNQMVLLPLFFSLLAIRAAQERKLLTPSALQTVRLVGSVALSVIGAFYFGASLLNPS